MTKNQIQEEYKKKSKNFMTPNVKEYVITPNNRVIELSTGTGIDGSKIWGVTEFEVTDGRLETTRRGKMHTSAKSARQHFNVLLGAF